MSDPRKISVGDDEYATTLAEWIRNQSPYQFNQMRADGGMEIVNCPNRTLDQPDFFVVAEAGPTLYDDETPGDAPITEGFIPKMLTYGGVTFQKIGQGKNRQLVIRRPNLPRELMAS